MNVSSLNKIFGNHAQNLGQALNLTSRRSGLIAQNLANVNVPGYKRQDIDFSVDPMDDEGNSSGSGIKELNQKFGLNQSASIRIDGNSVDVETEVMSMAEMELRYQLMSEITSRYFSGLKSVIREGR
ncbi:flagellar basal body rod protein FlgB [bacterium]|nr:flagellar basal-body rod protein FlgB [Armatimonadetes bacterium Uphvl-Ar1]MBA4293693.1 flagellar basal body rod protein FlgB [bacterium]